jgi:hypothetical protein
MQEQKRAGLSGTKPQGTGVKRNWEAGTVAELAQNNAVPTLMHAM